MTDTQISDCIDMLESVSNGDIAIAAHGDPANIVLGTINYELANGWLVEVSIDNRRWDGVQGFVDDRGRRLCPWDDQRPAIEQDSPLLWELLCWKPHRGEMAIWGWPL